MSIERLKPAYIHDENNKDGYNDTHEEIRPRITRFETRKCIRDQDVVSGSQTAFRYAGEPNKVFVNNCK